MTKVLVIDDDPACRDLVRNILHREGFEVSVATDGNDGMRVFFEVQPDVVITDLIMPDKEGIETIIELRKKSPELIIIAMSGGGRDDSRDYLPAAKSLGANATLYKPFESEELVNAINQLVGGD